MVHDKLFSEIKVIRTESGDVVIFTDSSSHMGAQYHETFSVCMCINTATLLQHWMQVMPQEITIALYVSSMVL